MNHNHQHDHELDPETMYTQETWDARYAESERMWSGRPNKLLVDEVADLAPRRALDVGCGEGADAVWLAGHTASAPSPQPTSSARRGARSATSSTRSLLGRPLHIRSDSA